MQNNNEQIERLADLAKSCHQIERHFKELPFFASLPYVTMPIERAVHHIEHARMYAGDLLRLAVLLENHRQTGFFDVAAHNGRYTGELEDFQTPKEFIQWAKSILRDLFYAVCDAFYDADSMMMVPNGARSSEWGVYTAQLRQHLKEADQCLGLWLGEIYEQEKKAPPGNAKEVADYLSGKQAAELIADNFDRNKAELTFNAIMADIGDSFLADFGDHRNKFDTQIFAEFPADKVEQTLRRQLGLPLKPETLKP
jgi:hypothetical protein